jgi:hypothetical protein
MGQQNLRFIVKYGDKYYLTQDLWEFDPAASVAGAQATSLAAIPGLLAAGDPVQAAASVSQQGVATLTAIKPGPNP